jgi:ribonuclease P protein component
VSNAVATLHYRSSESNRYGIVVSKAIGNAVHRNLVKRRVRAILSGHLQATPPIDGVFRMRPGTAALEFKVLEAEIGRLMEKIK